MERKRKTLKYLQMRLGSSQYPMCLSFGNNLEISFNSKGLEGHRQRQIWIPPPAKTTRKIRTCCEYKYPDPQIIMSIPGDEFSSHNLPFIIESSHLENFKAVIFPEHGKVSVKQNSTIQNARGNQMKRTRDSFNTQKRVLGEAERVLSANENMRKALSKNVILLKKNVEDINRTIREIENQDNIFKEKVRNPQADINEYWTLRKDNKHIIYKPQRKGTDLKRTNTKDSLQKELKRVEHLLEHIKTLNDSTMDKNENSLRTEFKKMKKIDDVLKSIETIDEYEVQENTNGPLTYQLKKVKSIENASLAYIKPIDEFIPEKENDKCEHEGLLNDSDKSLRKELESIKSIENLSLRNLKTTDEFTIEVANNRSEHEGTIHGSDKSTRSLESCGKCIPVENLMMQLADNMRKSKQLLDSVYQQDGIVESMQNKYIQGVEKLYYKQKNMLNELSLCQTSHNSSEGGVFEEKFSSLNEWDDAKESSQVHKLNSSPELRISRENSLEEKLALTNVKLLKLKRKQQEMAQLLSKAEDQFEPRNKSYDATNSSNIDSAYVTKNKDVSSFDESQITSDVGRYTNNPNKFDCQTIIKQTVRRFPITEVKTSKSNISPPVTHVLQEINKNVAQLLPSYSQCISCAENENSLEESSLEESISTSEDEPETFYDDSKKEKENELKATADDITHNHKYLTKGNKKHFSYKDQFKSTNVSDKSKDCIHQSNSSKTFSILPVLYKCDCSGSCHNVKHFNPEDFDMSSLVNTHIDNPLGNKDNSNREPTWMEMDYSKHKNADKLKTFPSENTDGHQFKKKTTTAKKATGPSFRAADIKQFTPKNIHNKSRRNHVDKSQTEFNQSLTVPFTGIYQCPDPCTNPKHLKDTPIDQNRLKNNKNAQHFLRVTNGLQRSLTDEAELKSKQGKYISIQTTEHDQPQAGKNMELLPDANLEKKHVKCNFKRNMQQLLNTPNPNSFSGNAVRTKAKDAAIQKSEFNRSPSQRKDPLEMIDEKLPDYRDWMMHGPYDSSTPKQNRRNKQKTQDINHTISELDQSQLMKNVKYLSDKNYNNAPSEHTDWKSYGLNTSTRKPRGRHELRSSDKTFYNNQRPVRIENKTDSKQKSSEKSRFKARTSQNKDVQRIHEKIDELYEDIMS